jgi:hypothetical protein
MKTLKLFLVVLLISGSVYASESDDLGTTVGEKEWHKLDTSAFCGDLRPKNVVSRKSADAVVNAPGANKGYKGI